MVIFILLAKGIVMRDTLVDEYVNDENWRVRENSNTSFSLQGLNNFITSAVTKEYWLTKIYTDDITQAYKNGDIHIHDLGLLSAYCSGWDLYDFLSTGFTGAVGKINSNPPKHFSSALGQICNFFFTIQGETAGAVAFSNFDTLLAPFIYYDNLSAEEVKQQLQEFIFNMNVPTRTGFQAPFTNVTLDFTVPSTFLDRPVLIGGELKEETYSQFQKEMDIFNNILFEILAEGDSSGRIFSFPIPTINITKDFNWDNEVLDSFWRATCKYGIPYFSNLISSDLSPEDILSMCCRLKVDLTELRNKGGGLFGSNPLTGSLGICTVNLPRAAYLSDGSVEKFLDRILSMMDICKDSLLKKREVIEELTELGLYPYARFYLRNIKARDEKYWGNHFSTIGIVGMHEACLNLLGEGIDSVKGRELAIRLLNVMRNRLSEYQKNTGTYFNLEATPAEGTSSRLAFIDKQNLPGIITSGDSKAPFYTNSTQLPVDFDGNAIDVIEHQSEIQSLYTGGTVSHIFIGEEQIDPAAAKSFIKQVFSNYSLPYISFTPTFSICSKHGYLKGRVDKCPECNSDCEVYSRVVGYIRPVSLWNDGKQLEFDQRTTFKI